MPSRSAACAKVMPGSARQRTISSRSSSCRATQAPDGAGEDLGRKVTGVGHFGAGRSVADDLAELPDVLRPVVGGERALGGGREGDPVSAVPAGEVVGEGHDVVRAAA
jgi:hypothetical protein